MAIIFSRSNSYQSLFSSSFVFQSALTKKKEAQLHPSIILAFTYYAKTSPRAAVVVACISRKLKNIAYNILYKRVDLHDLRTAKSFAESIRHNPDAARLVKEIRVYGASHFQNSLSTIVKCTSLERISVHFGDQFKQCSLWTITRAMFNTIGFIGKPSFQLPRPTHLHVVGKTAIDLVPEALQFNATIGHLSGLQAISYICLQWTENPFKSESEVKNIRGLVSNILRSRHLISLQRLWLKIPVLLKDSKSFTVHEYFEDIDDIRFVLSTVHVAWEKDLVAPNAVTMNGCLKEFSWRSVGVKHS